LKKESLLAVTALLQIVTTHDEEKSHVLQEIVSNTANFIYVPSVSSI